MPENENGGNGTAGNGTPDSGASAANVPVVTLEAVASTGKHVSAFLLRRIAEAVDGFRGETVFCRARFTPTPAFDYEVDVKSDRTEFPPNTEFGVFGPFFTQEAKGPNRNNTPIESITIKLNNGKVINVDPKKSDALFWTVSAVEKFLVPYYASVNSALMANAVLSGFDRADMVCAEHGPGTENGVRRLSDAVDPTGQIPLVPMPILTDPVAQQQGPKPGLQFVSLL